MAKSFSRTDRIAGLMHRELSQLLCFDAKDPRFHDLTITRVSVARDLSFAKIYISTLLHKEQMPSILQALNHAEPYFRGQLARRMQLRIVPQLRFVGDDSLENANRLQNLIDEAIKRDAAQKLVDEEEQKPSE